MKVKLASVFINESNKDKVPYTDKDGNQCYRVVITPEGGGEKASMWVDASKAQFVMPTVALWKKGDEVDIEMEKEGDFLNFTITPLEERVAKIEAWMALIGDKK